VPIEAEAETGRCCLDCGATLTGTYCAACGQRASELNRPIRELVLEWLDGIWSFDRRLLRTLGPLICRPGLLTLEYLAGRRRRYVEPIKLYLAFSLVLFLLMGVSGYSVVIAGTAGSEQSAPIRVILDEPGAGSEAGQADRQSPIVALLLRQYEDSPERFNQTFLNRLARTVILLVPIFALILKLLYRRELYVKHLIMSLHTHAFGFIVISLALLPDLVLGRPAGSTMPIGNLVVIGYTFLAMRRVYGQSRLRTTAKLVALLLSYLVALVLTMALTMALTLGLTLLAG